MGARTGRQYVERLRATPRDLWIAGEHVTDPMTHPAFRHIIRSVASLYDMQHDRGAARRDDLHLASSSGDRVGLSFLMPRSHEDLPRVRR